MTPRVVDEDWPTAGRRTCATCGKTERLFEAEDWPDVETAPHRGFTATDIERRLRDAIYATPDDDEPRAVYADWLIERGDPLGKFMGLQLGRVRRGKALPSREEQELLNTHWRSWLGGIGAALLPAQVTFARGMWSECDLLYRTIALEFAGDEAWSTVRRLRVGFGREKEMTALLAGPLRHSLREVWVGPDSPELDIVLDAGVALERVDFAPRRTPPDLTRVAKLAVGLHYLAKDVPAFLDATDAAGVANVTLTLDDIQRGDMEAVFARAHRSTATQIAIVVPRYVYRFARAGGRLVLRRLEFIPDKIAGASLVDASYRLRAVEPYVDPQVEVTIRKTPPGMTEQAAELGLRLVELATSFAISPMA